MQPEASSVGSSTASATEVGVPAAGTALWSTSLVIFGSEMRGIPQQHVELSILYAVSAAYGRAMLLDDREAWYSAFGAALTDHDWTDDRSTPFHQPAPSREMFSGRDFAVRAMKGHLRREVDLGVFADGLDRWLASRRSSPAFGLPCRRAAFIAGVARLTEPRTVTVSLCGIDYATKAPFLTDSLTDHVDASGAEASATYRQYSHVYGDDVEGRIATLKEQLGDRVTSRIERLDLRSPGPHA